MPQRRGRSGLEMKMRPKAIASACPGRDRGVRGLAGEAAGRDQHAFPDRAEQHHGEGTSGD